MKALQIRIEYESKQNVIARTLIISKKYDFDVLHRVIQIAFALENIELYEFQVNDLIVKRIKGNKKSRQSSMKLASLKKAMSFMYRYDVFEHLNFTCVVEDIIDTKINYPFVSEFEGKNLYENYRQSKRQGSQFEIEWCNECLKGFSQLESDIQPYYKLVEENFKKLISIKNWQDYVHGNVVEIACPHQRNVYVGADATQDVSLDFYLNRTKLVQYLRKNNNAIDTSVCKYHDTISMNICKLQETDEVQYFDCVVAPFGYNLDRNSVYQINCLIPGDEIVLFTYAYARYVECIKLMAEKNFNVNEQKLINFGLKGKMEIKELDFMNDQIYIELREEQLEVMNLQCVNHDTLQVDVVSVYDDAAEEERQLYPSFLILADQISLEEIILENGSFKTIASEIIQSLIPLLFHNGIYKTIQVRDANMYDLLFKICDQLKIELEIVDHMEQIDSYIYQSYLVNEFEFDQYDLDHELLISQLKDIKQHVKSKELYELINNEKLELIDKDFESLMDLLDDIEGVKAPIDYKKLN